MAGFADDGPMLRAFAIQGNRQRLDGGAMFGNAPRALWEKWCKPDEQSRIELACRGLLVETPSRRILLETGIGAFFEPSLRERYGVVSAEHELLQGLQGLGFAPESIDAVVLSHLHFDHAGGLLNAYRENMPLCLAFPKADYIVSRRAFERACHPHARDRASFIPDLQDLLRASGRLKLIDGPDDLQALLGPHFSCLESDGHTPGMLHTEVTGKKAQVFFAADLVPGVPWIHVPITMGYDRFPERLIEEKGEIFARLLESGSHLFFTHDPTFCVAQLSRSAVGRYSPLAPSPDWQGGWDLDSSDGPPNGN